MEEDKMSEHEIIGTELANEVINTQVTEANAGTGLNLGTKVAIGATIGLAAWKAGELIVKGFKAVRNKIKSRRAAKAEQPKVDEEFHMPSVDESRFDD